jgi:hypothetical protein
VVDESPCRALPCCRTLRDPSCKSRQSTAFDQDLSRPLRAPEVVFRAACSVDLAALVRSSPRSTARRDTNDTNSTATRHRHDTDRMYCGCATAGAAELN